MDASYTHPRDATATPLALQSTAISGIGSTFGALLLSTFFSLIGDIPFLKTLGSPSYQYLVIDYFNPQGLVAGTWSVEGIIIILSQRRNDMNFMLFSFSVDRRYMPIVLLVLLLFSHYTLLLKSLVPGSGIVSFTDHEFERLSSRAWMMTTILAVAISIDLTVTGTLVFILRKSYTGFERTNTVLHTLSLYAVIATGLNTALTVPALVYGLKSHLVGSSNDTPPMAAFSLHGTSPSETPSSGAPQAQNELVLRPPPATYAMVRIQMPRTAGREDARLGEAVESLDTKIGGPERADILA
ncbi:hypothetical protein V8D89_001600 [Ganoderma adspersum]